mmetsp:Transcript_90418/g.264577  ORF Transcript_90418/g.264577 Transcript_90418/m.264577 type:complete len:291 (+) Transcript_90418:127-999(+)
MRGIGGRASWDPRRAPRSWRNCLLTAWPVSQPHQALTRLFITGLAACKSSIRSYPSICVEMHGSPVRLVQVQATDWAPPGLCQPLQQAWLMEPVATCKLAPWHTVFIFAAKADHALLLGVHLVGHQHGDVLHDVGVCAAVAQELPEPSDQRPSREGGDGGDEQHDGLERLQHRRLYDELADLPAVPRLVQQQNGTEAPAEQEKRHRGHADRPPELQHQEAQQPDLQGAVADLVLGRYVCGHSTEEQPHGYGQGEHRAAERHDDALPHLPNESRDARSLQIVQLARKHRIQ